MNRKAQFDINFGIDKPKNKKDVRRVFNRTQKNEILAQQNNKCAKCHKKLDPRVIEFHHMKAWSSKGKTIVKNGAALCPNCHKKVHHEERLKKTDKPRTSKIKSRSLLDLKIEPQLKRGRKKKDPFSFGL